MQLSINAKYFTWTRPNVPQRSVDEAFRLCAEAGFRLLNYTPALDSKWESRVDEALRAAEKYDLIIEQSHAPFNYYKKDSAEEFARQLDCCVEASKRMNVRHMVFHMDEYHAPSIEAYDPEAALKSAYEALAPHIEKALSYGIEIALETIFEDRVTSKKEGRSHFGGTIEELEASLAKFDHPNVGCCWDFGHARIAFGDKQLEIMRRLGKKIICTHTHDNYYNKDLHVMPFMGDLPWGDLMRTLREIGYENSLTFELVYGRLPDRLTPSFLKLLYDTGLVLVDLFDGKEVL